jgi:predicted signal transduction protein with EAL and GGDEF domain
VGSIREGDTVARFGGDEFIVMLETMGATTDEAIGQAEIVARKLMAILSQPYGLSGRVHHTTLSVGIALFRGQTQSVDEILKRADLAMYKAKGAGGNAVHFFDPAMQAAVTARAVLEVDLRQGLKSKALFPHYQAVVDAEGRLMGVEALARWRHPQRGMVLPAEFISLAEKTGLILDLGLQILRAACQQLVAWAGQPETAALTVSVNVSARQFRQPDFAAQVMAVIAETGAAPGLLKLELTESLLLSDVEDIIAKMNELQAHGLGFSLDDFGTGYSSLAYLKRLPLKQLKIDQSFVRDVLTDANDAAIVRTILALARSMDLVAVAEGVETEGQRQFLLDHGCTAFQGYLFGRPGPVEAFALPA